MLDGIIVWFWSGLLGVLRRCHIRSIRCLILLVPDFFLAINGQPDKSPAFLGLSALAAFAFLLLAPVIHALTSPRDTAVSNDRAMTIVLAIAVSSAILFLVAQIVFMASFLWSAFSGKTIGR